MQNTSDTESKKHESSNELVNAEAEYKKINKELKEVEQKMMIARDKAVKACSPPDNNVIDCNLLSGGLTNISKPASKGSSDSKVLYKQH